MKHGLAFLMVKSKTLMDDPKIGQKIVKENTTSFSKLFGDTLAKGMNSKVSVWLEPCNLSREFNFDSSAFDTIVCTLFNCGALIRRTTAVT
jgi:hypothetical protein